MKLLRDTMKESRAGTKMSCILELLGKKITCIYFSGDMCYLCGATLVVFTNIVFTEIDVFGAFVCACWCPIHCCLIIIVKSSAFECILHAKVLRAIFDAL